MDNDVTALLGGMGPHCWAAFSLVFSLSVLVLRPYHTWRSTWCSVCRYWFYVPTLRGVQHGVQFVGTCFTSLPYVAFSMVFSLSVLTGTTNCVAYSTTLFVKMCRRLTVTQRYDESRTKRNEMSVSRRHILDETPLKKMK